MASSASSWERKVFEIDRFVIWRKERVEGVGGKESGDDVDVDDAKPSLMISTDPPAAVAKPSSSNLTDK